MVYIDKFDYYNRDGNITKVIPTKRIVQSWAFKWVNALFDSYPSSRIFVDIGAKEKFAQTYIASFEEES